MFEALATSVEENLFVIAADGRTPEYVSPAYETIFGIAHEDIEDQMDWFEIVHPDDRDALLEQFRTTFQTHEPMDARYRIQRPDGAKRWVETSVRPDRGPDGEVARFVGVSRDVTERVEAEAAREEAIRREAEIERLEEIDRYRTHFLNTAAHELATPITPVKFQLEALKDGMHGELTEGQAEAVDLMDRNLRRLERMIHDLLDASRLEAGSLAVVPEEVDLVELVETTVASLTQWAEDATLEIEVDAPATCPAVLDPERVEQVLANLLDNAIKFTPRDGRIEVRLEVVDESARITVEDTGIGFDPEHAERIFEPFHQEDHGRSDGTGLGLVIARGLARAHGGSLTAESGGEGQGATFTLEVPLEAAPEATTTSDAGGSPGPSPA